MQDQQGYPRGYVSQHVRRILTHRGHPPLQGRISLLVLDGNARTPVPQHPGPPPDSDRPPSVLVAGHLAQRIAGLMRRLDHQRRAVFPSKKSDTCRNSKNAGVRRRLRSSWASAEDLCDWVQTSVCGYFRPSTISGLFACHRPVPSVNAFWREFSAATRASRLRSTGDRGGRAFLTGKIVLFRQCSCVFRYTHIKRRLQSALAKDVPSCSVSNMLLQ